MKESEHDLSLLKTKDIAQLIYNRYYLFFDKDVNEDNPVKIECIDGVSKFVIGDNVIANCREVEELIWNAYKTGTVKNITSEKDEPKVVAIIKDSLLYGWLSDEIEKVKK